MSRVKSAAAGNLLGAASVAGAVLLTFFYYGIFSAWELWLFAGVGLVLGLVWAWRVKMIQMPQLVATLNGFTGAVSTIVAVISLQGAGPNAFARGTAGLALAVGTLTLTGSAIAAAKLHKLMGQNPTVWKGHRAITVCAILFMLLSVAALVLFPEWFWLCVLVCAVVSGFFGVAFAVRVGGADMPIVISLLNSLSGVAGAVAGMAIGDPLLVAVGGIVGASGLLLTQVMCRAMNSKLTDILAGKTSTAPVAEPMKEAEAAPEPVEEALRESEEPAGDVNPSQLLKDAKSVIIIPGYGMALAQAQHLVKRLSDLLERNGAQVNFAIHPVAGRMPGHMNVLLAEADVDYDKMLEMDDVNLMFGSSDLAIVVGANDVISPAAETAEGTPIFGLPILHADRARNLIICNYDLSPGYAGVENPLYTKPGVIMMLGDAAETLQTLIDGM